jgi:hypothetical protein
MRQDDLPPLHPKDRSGSLSKSFGIFWREDIRNNEEYVPLRLLFKNFALTVEAVSVEPLCGELSSSF